MSIFALALFCFQACLVQNVFGFCGDAFAYGPYSAAWAGAPWSESFGPYLGYGYGAYELYGFGPFSGPLGAPFTGILAGPFAGPFVGPLADPFPLITGPEGAYGGAGVGEVRVAGELPSAGATVVAGEVPILGAVEFAGPVCAAGTVTIAGTCGCGCAGTFLY